MAVELLVAAVGGAFPGDVTYLMADPCSDLSYVAVLADYELVESTIMSVRQGDNLLFLIIGSLLADWSMLRSA